LWGVFFGLLAVSGCSSAGDSVEDGVSQAPGGDDGGASDADGGDVPEDPCSPGLVECDGECVDVQSSSAHCGGCGKACTEGHHCEEGVCVCDAEGETDCDGVCIDLASDVENCGECGNACGEGYACIEGECVVPFEDECTRV